VLASDVKIEKIEKDRDLRMRDAGLGDVRLLAALLAAFLLGLLGTMASAPLLGYVR
jgi:hypothetical protein